MVGDGLPGRARKLPAVRFPRFLRGAAIPGLGRRLNETEMSIFEKRARQVQRDRRPEIVDRGGGFLERIEVHTTEHERGHGGARVARMFGHGSPQRLDRVAGMTGKSGYVGEREKLLQISCFGATRDALGAEVPISFVISALLHELSPRSCRRRWRRRARRLVHEGGLRRWHKGRW